MSRMQDRIARIIQLPIKQQVRCLLNAVEKGLPLWEKLERQNTRSHVGAVLLQSCADWIDDSITSAQLLLRMKQFRKLEQTALQSMNDPLAARVGYAIYSVPLIALQKCKEVHDDVFDPLCISAAQS